jgi:hypothetical protein
MEKVGGIISLNVADQHRNVAVDVLNYHLVMYVMVWGIWCRIMMMNSRIN